MNFFSNLSIRFKILIPLVLIILISSVVFIISGNYYIKIINEKAFENYLKSKKNTINESLMALEDKALYGASAIASLDYVKKAYKMMNETGNQEEATAILKEEMGKTTKFIEETTGSPGKIHFHYPPAKSFFRSWTDKKGDDLSSFRFTLLEISKTHKAVKGIEIGRGGFVIRGIVPIMDDNQYLGSVECYFFN